MSLPFTFLILIASVNLTFSRDVGLPPKFTIEPGNHLGHDGILYVKQGEPAKVKCKAKGSPTPSYKWVRFNEDNVEYEDMGPDLISTSIEATGEHLISIQEDGLYSCVAYNTYGSAIASPIAIKTAEISQFPGNAGSYPETLEVVVSQAVSLPCHNVDKLISKPRPEIRWERKRSGDQYSSRVILKSNMAIDPSGTLHFLWVEDDDLNCVYMCSAANYKLQGTMLNPHSIYLKKVTGEITPHAPELLYSSTHVTVLSGSRAQLTCIFSFFPDMNQPSISWYLGESKLGTRQTLTIPGNVSMATAEVSNEYKCVAKSGKYETSAKVKLTTVSPPVFVPNKGLVNEIVPVGEDAVFTCVARFQSEPPVWYINGKELDENELNSDSYSLSHDGTSLTVRHVSLQDQQCLQCSVQNHHGRIHGNGCLTVIDKIMVLKGPSLVYTLEPGTTIVSEVEATCDELYIDKLQYNWIVYTQSGNNHDIIELPTQALNRYLKTSQQGEALSIYNPRPNGSLGTDLFSTLKSYPYSTELAVRISHPFEQVVLNFTLRQLEADDGSEGPAGMQKPLDAPREASVATVKTSSYALIISLVTLLCNLQLVHVIIH